MTNPTADRPSYLLPLWTAWRRRGRPLLSLLALAPAAFLILARSAGWDAPWKEARTLYEDPSIIVLGLTALLWGVRAALARSGLLLLIAVQAAIFCCREINFDLAHKYVYWATGLVVILVAAWFCRNGRRLDPDRISWAQVSVFVAAVAAYAVAMLIQRRAFRFIPGEDAMHIGLEEASELGAHLIFLAAALVGPWRRRA